MGMYTELNVAFNLNKDTDYHTVIEPLKSMMGDQTLVNRLIHKPDHPLFTRSRYKYMLRCDSYYFDGESHSTVGYDKIANFWSVTIRCNLKNYENEIELFLDWISQYIEDSNNSSYLGTARYEEDDTPTLIYRESDGKIHLYRVTDMERV